MRQAGAVVALVAAGIVGFVAWWLGRGEVAPATDLPQAKSGRAVASEPAPRPAQSGVGSPAESGRVDASPPQPASPTARPEPSEPKLTEEQSRQVDRIVKFVPEARARVVELLANDPARFSELVGIVETGRSAIGELQTEAYRIQDKIVEGRLREGRFETEPVGNQVPKPATPGETVCSQIRFDPASGQDIRRVFRIVPGESDDLDQIRSRMESERLGIAKVVIDYLSAAR